VVPLLLYNRVHKELRAHLTMCVLTIVRFNTKASGIRVHVFKHVTNLDETFVSLSSRDRSERVILNEGEYYKLHWALASRHGIMFGRPKLVDFRKSGEKYVIETEMYDFINRVTLTDDDIESITDEDIIRYLEHN